MMILDQDPKDILVSVVIAHAALVQHKNFVEENGALLEENKTLREILKKCLKVTPPNSLPWEGSISYWGGQQIEPNEAQLLREMFDDI